MVTNLEIAVYFRSQNMRKVNFAWQMLYHWQHVISFWPVGGMGPLGLRTHARTSVVCKRLIGYRSLMVGTNKIYSIYRLYFREIFIWPPARANSPWCSLMLAWEGARLFCASISFCKRPIAKCACVLDEPTNDLFDIDDTRKHIFQRSYSKPTPVTCAVLVSHSSRFVLRITLSVRKP